MADKTNTQEHKQNCKKRKVYELLKHCKIIILNIRQDNIIKLQDILYLISKENETGL